MSCCRDNINTSSQDVSITVTSTRVRCRDLPHDIRQPHEDTEDLPRSVSPLNYLAQDGWKNPSTYSGGRFSRTRLAVTNSKSILWVLEPWGHPLEVWLTGPEGPLVPRGGSGGFVEPWGPTGNPTRSPCPRITRRMSARSPCPRITCRMSASD